MIMTKEEFKKIRKKLGKTQLEMARDLDVRDTYISWFETGVRPVPYKFLQRIADKYKMTFKITIKPR